MTAILDPQRCVELTRVIAGGDDGLVGRFADGAEFAVFVNDLNDNFEALVPASQPFSVQVLHYVNSRNRRGEIGELLDLLVTQVESRDDLLAIVKGLVDYINVAKAGRSWFLSYAGLEKNSYDELERNNVFDCFEDMLLRDAAAKSNSRQSETLKEDLNRSNFFVALVGRYYINSNIASGVFETAFGNWLSRISSDPTLQQRLVVLWLDPEGRQWWESRYQGKIPPGGQALVKALNANPATLRTELQDWFDNKRGPEQPPIDNHDPQLAAVAAPKRVVVLGEPVDALPGSVATAIDGLVSYLKARAPDLVQHWPDGWSAKILQPNERTELLARNPLFVRAVRDRAATIRESQADLMAYLMTALGFSPAQWKSEFDRLSRVYWRPDGPEWVENGAGLGWTGQPQELGARLAELAAFPGKPDRKAIVRYEDPRADNESRTDLNRHLIIGALQSAASHDAAGATILPNTVPISFEKIEDSIKKFTKNGLNVIALHDLDARPLDMEDTVRRFEGADQRIDNAVSSVFGYVERTPVLRVAILLKNAAVFDGLRFDQSSSVRRWFLLKCPSGSNGEPTYDEADYMNIKTEARNILANAGE